MKILLCILYAGTLLSLLFYVLAYLKENQIKNSGNDSENPKDNCNNYASFCPLKSLLANIAFSFGVISMIWFIAIVLL